MSQARSIRLVKSDELPGESTVEAMGARSRRLGVRREDPVKGFRRLPGGVGRRGHGVKAAPWAPQMVAAGVCIARRDSSGASLRVGERRGGRRQGIVGLLLPLGPLVRSIALTPGLFRRQFEHQLLLWACGCGCASALVPLQRYFNTFIRNIYIYTHTYRYSKKL